MRGPSWGQLLLLAGAVAVVSWSLTGLVRRYALWREVLDRPSDRSAHTAPTPRGGGLAVAAAIFAGLGLAVAVGLIGRALGLALVGGGAAVSLVGWLDDRRGLSPVSRLIVHVGAAIYAVVLLDGLPRASVWGGADLGLVGSALAVLGLVWAVNLYNFMDGLDGLAATEAVQVGCAGAVLSWFVGDGDTAVACGLVAAAATGFLRWNWAPARIFLGDVGSGLFGFLFGVLALSAERAAGLPIVIWMILLAIFGFDATITLLRRTLRGEIWYAPHRQHAYQRLAHFGWSHARVVVAVVVLNLLLFGLAVTAVLKPGCTGEVATAALVAVTVVYMAVELATPMRADRNAAPGRLGDAAT